MVQEDPKIVGSQRVDQKPFPKTFFKTKKKEKKKRKQAQSRFARTLSAK